METTTSLLSNFYGLSFTKESPKNRTPGTSGTLGTPRTPGTLRTPRITGTPRTLRTPRTLGTPKLTSYLGNTTKEPQLSFSSSSSVDESSQNLNSEVNTSSEDVTAHNLLTVSIMDDEIDKEIDFEFVKFKNFNLGNEDEVTQNLAIEEVINNNNNNEKQQITIDKEDLQDTYSEISSIVRLGAKNKKRGSKFEKKEHFEVRKPRIDTEVLKKIPVFNNNFCDLSNNDLEEFPVEVISRIVNVKMLYLGNNNLTNLPDELFEKLKFLEWLDLRNNKFKVLPKGLKNHKSLETILLQGNEIKSLPEELCTLENLKAVNVGDGCVFPPPEVWKKGFKEVMEVLRKEWNKNHPEEYIPRKDEKLPILSQEIFGSSKRPKCKPQSSKFPKDSRLRRLNYKPSNKCPQIRKLLCPDCVNSLTKTQNEAPGSPDSEGGYPLKVHMVKSRTKRNKEFLENEETYLGSKDWGASKKDLGLTVDLDKEGEGEGEAGLERGKVRREKVSLAEEMKRMEDIKVKERVYNVITNDRIVTKLRPMKLGDPNWILGFVENYLGFSKQVVAPFTGFKKG